jgi:hypothetical protein
MIGHTSVIRIDELKLETLLTAPLDGSGYRHSPAALTSCRDFRADWKGVLNVVVVFAACFLLVSCVAYFSFLMMKTICSSETSVNFYSITRRHILEHSLHIYGF